MSTVCCLVTLIRDRSQSARQKMTTFQTYLPTPHQKNEKKRNEIVCIRRVKFLKPSTYLPKLTRGLWTIPYANNHGVQLFYCHFGSPGPLLLTTPSRKTGAIWNMPCISMREGGVCKMSKVLLQPPWVHVGGWEALLPICNFTNTLHKEHI